jgi:ATP-dependent helicase HrpB
VLPATDLPVEEAIPTLRTALAGRHGAVLVAPPGAGKTTLVPLRLLHEAWLDGRRILLLEPRRLAARAAARRMAHLVGDEVGGLVGYQTRDERRIGTSTRIEVLTEGILTRRLQSDPELPGVGLVIFDEVHERNLPTDLGLALCLDARSNLRPDLRVLAMSATPDADRFARVLADGGGPAPIVTAEGRQHPVEVRWTPLGRGERPVEATVGVVLRALREEPGDVLVFLPGIGEIRRAAALLELSVTDDVDVRPLAGALALAEQDRALAPSPPGRRRVVLSTDIAETSLTVDGVRVVVDTGLARVPRYDVRTGMTRLTTVTTSRASAEQRAGRAGRLGPGVCYRLWSTIEHATRRAHLDPEITQVDLAGLALELAAWGTPVDRLAFPDPPPAKPLRQAHELLGELEALDADGRLTDTGRAMLPLPLHPRLAHMVTTARTEGDRALACILAAVLDERDVLRGRRDDLPVDVALRVALVTGATDDDRADRRALGAVRERARDLARRAGVSSDDMLERADPERAGAVLLAAYPDRLAKRRQPGQFQLRTGTAAWIPRTDPLADEAFVVAADVDGDRKNTRVRLAAAVEPADIADVLAEQVTVERTVSWDRERDDLVEQVERRLGRMLLGTEQRRPEPGPKTTAALLERVRATKLAALPWTPAASALRARVRFLHRTLGDPWPDWGDRALLGTLDEWLTPHLAGMTGSDDLSRLDLRVLLASRLPWPEASRLDDLAPARLTVTSGRQVSIDYDAAAEGEGPPVLSVRVQDVYGTTEHPTVCDGRVPLLLSLLSPSDRPIQVTADLPGFWAGSWAEVRKEMAGRYPKHAWPLDPRSL